MKKKIIIITIPLLIVSILFLTQKNYFSSNERITEIKSKSIKQENLLSMMLETDAGSGNYVMTTSSIWPTDGYVFNSELSKCDNGGTLSWDDTNKQIVFSGNISDKCYVYFDVYNPLSLVDYVKSQYTGTQGKNGLYYHDSTLTNGAGDNSYRYAGANPNNYICFGSSESTCPTDNLYRIIGVFGENNHGVTGQQLVKIIKNASIGNNRWEGNGKTNNWSTASLNTTLNTEYLTNRLSQYENKIATVTWKIGGFTNTNNEISTANAKKIYTNEFSSSKKTTEGKLGLMYASDYGFATSSSNWSAYLINYETETIRNNNYLYSESNEWTLTIYPGTDVSSWIVTGNGSISSTDISNNYATRPTFYLTSDIQYTGGSGTSTDPYRVN